ncbi:unnamed protein product, partial [Candidula unifasciata]
TTQRVSSVAGNYVITVEQDTSVSNNNYSFYEYFRVDYNQIQNFWYTTMIKPIDRDGPTSSLNDDVNVLQFRFLCKPPNQSIIYSVLRIQITDKNDNYPEFVRQPYTTSISELTPVGQIFYSSISAVDKDEAENRQIVYYLTDTPGAM